MNLQKLQTTVGLSDDEFNDSMELAQIQHQDGEYTQEDVESVLDTARSLGYVSSDAVAAIAAAQQQNPSAEPDDLVLSASENLQHSFSGQGLAIPDDVIIAMVEDAIASGSKLAEINYAATIGSYKATMKRNQNRLVGEISTANQSLAETLKVVSTNMGTFVGEYIPETDATPVNQYLKQSGDRARKLLAANQEGDQRHQQQVKQITSGRRNLEGLLALAASRKMS